MHSSQKTNWRHDTHSLCADSAAIVTDILFLTPISCLSREDGWNDNLFTQKNNIFVYLIWIWAEADLQIPLWYFRKHCGACLYRSVTNLLCHTMNHTGWLTPELHRLTEGISATNNTDNVFQRGSVFHGFSLLCGLCCFVWFRFDTVYFSSSSQEKGRQKYPLKAVFSLKIRWDLPVWNRIPGVLE